MAVTFMDGFDQQIPNLAAGYILESNRASLTLMASPDGDNMLQVGMTAGTAAVAAYQHIRRKVPTGWGNRFGFGVLVNVARSGAFQIAQIDNDPTSGAQGIITFGKDASNFCTINGVATEIAFELSVYHFLELELDKVALVARVWLNNELVGTAPMTGTETKLSYWFGFDTVNTSTIATNVAYFNDHYVSDGNSTLNNQRVGKVKVVTRLPQTDFVTEFTPLSGASNAAMVDDPGAPDGDTTYVFGNLEGTVDLYNNTDDLPFPDAPVLAVAVTVVARKEGPEARSVAPQVQVDGADAVGDRVSLLVGSYTTGTTVFNANPKTGGTWDASSAAAAKFGQVLVV
jgi:hypothetical protein